MATVNVKRVYDSQNDSDGFRVLVDRLWPRGISKDKARVDLWLKDVGPSDDLRKWFGHDPAKYDEFGLRYKKELENNPAFERLQAIVRNNKAVTLVYSAKDEAHNQAVVLRDFLTKN